MTKLKLKTRIVAFTKVEKDNETSLHFPIVYFATGKTLKTKTYCFVVFGFEVDLIFTK